MNKFFNMIALQFYGVACAGMLTHWIKKWLYNEVDGHAIDWYIQNRKYTIGVLFTVIGGVASGIGGGLFTNPTDATQVALCFTGAFAIDTLNKQ